MTQTNPYKVTFTATRGVIAGVVIVEARGQNRTGGYVTRLERAPNGLQPPQALLFNQKPAGMAAQAISSFRVSMNLPVEDGQGEVIVLMPEGGGRTVAIT